MEYSKNQKEKSNSSNLLKKLGLRISKETPEGILKREFMSFLLKERRKIQIPKGTEFCPLIYSNCKELRHIDSNCFITKAPGCPEYMKYLEESSKQEEYSKPQLQEVYS